MAYSFFASFGLPVVIVRPFNTYGPRQSARAVIPTIITQIANGQMQIKLGAVYPLAESEFLVDDREIPANWPRAYALDVGWNRTAALWGARDPNTQVTYLYAEHYRGQAEPPIHAAAIKTRGDWIPGVIDPSSAGHGQHDGKQILKLYKDHGLDVMPADNDVDAGILAVWQGLSTGSIKVFKSLQHWRTEYRMYRRDEKGRIVKENDHLMDSTRYLILSGMKRATVFTATHRIPPSRPSAHGQGTGL